MAHGCRCPSTHPCCRLPTTSLLLLLVVQDGNSVGYGFVEFASEDDLRAAYRKADGKKVDGRRILVDVERGRTVPGEHEDALL